MSLEKIVKAINEHDKFLICAHINLEGDALGSQLALANLLKKLNKKVFLVDSDYIPQAYKFLPGVRNIRRKVTPDMDFDVIVYVDCSDVERAGDITESFPKNKLILNIDHHVSNKLFGNVNWVDPNNSSAAEMIYRLYKRMNVKLTHQDALLLYVGIVTDTGSFRYSNTSSFTHSVAADLIRFNISANEVFSKIYEANSITDVVVLNKVLATLQQHKNKKVIYLKLTRDMLPEGKGKFDQSEHILNFARSIKGGEVIILFKHVELGNITRVNFRSKGKIDVNKIAAYFGGGGHKTASGCTIKDDIDIAIKKVLARVDKEFRNVKEK